MFGHKGALGEAAVIRRSASPRHRNEHDSGMSVREAARYAACACVSEAVNPPAAMTSEGGLKATRLVAEGGSTDSIFTAIGRLGLNVGLGGSAIDIGESLSNGWLKSCPAANGE